MAGFSFDSRPHPSQYCIYPTSTLSLARRRSMHSPGSIVYSVNLLLISLVFALAPIAFGQQQNAPAGIQKISHVVFLIKENRSYDNMFGAFNAKYGTKTCTLSRSEGTRLNSSHLVISYAVF